MLPEDYDVDIYTEEFEIGKLMQVVEIPRVLKISNSFSQAESAIAELKLEPEYTPRSKANRLVVDGRSSIPHAMRIAFRYNEIDALMGNPRLCADTDAPLRDGYHMAYTQDYAIPTSHLLESLDETNPDDIKAFMELIDAYVETQLLLCKHSIFDKTFKFTDNFGVFPDFTVPWSTKERLRMLDLGELAFDLTTVLETVNRKDWEQIAHKPEYTQLPKVLQEYFNMQCNKHLTAENVVERWNKPGMPLHSQVPIARALDGKIPLRLPRVLWEKSV